MTKHNEIIKLLNRHGHASGPYYRNERYFSCARWYTHDVWVFNGYDGSFQFNVYGEREQISVVINLAPINTRKPKQINRFKKVFKFYMNIWRSTFSSDREAKDKLILMAKKKIDLFGDFLK